MNSGEMTTQGFPTSRLVLTIVTVWSPSDDLGFDGAPVAGAVVCRRGHGDDGTVVDLVRELVGVVAADVVEADLRAVALEGDRLACHVRARLVGLSDAPSLVGGEAGAGQDGKVAVWLA
jgi:hypothetical protein